MPPLTPPTKEETDSLDAKSKAKLTYFKVLSFILAGAALTVQPIITTYYQERANERRDEISRIEAQSKASLEMGRAALDQVSLLSTRLGELTSLNASLQKETTDLKRELDSLSEKYQRLLLDYKEVLADKTKLEAQVARLIQLTEPKNESGN